MKKNMTTKQIAQTIKDAFQIHEKSWVGRSSSGDYTLDMEESFQRACEKNKIDPDMWYVLYLAFDWSNDLGDWVDNILDHGSLEGMFVTNMLEKE